MHEIGSNTLLYTIPIESMSGPLNVITQVFTRQPYSGPVESTELYELVGNERTYVDVHTLDRLAGQLRGTLKPENANWSNFTHADCS